MTEPNGPDPVPAAPLPEGDPGPGVETGADVEAGTGAPGPLADLEQRPVTEHVAVFEQEHERLRRELGTIDQL